MKRPKPQFTLRSMMAAVVAAAILLASGIGLARLARRAGIHEQRALAHAEAERAARRKVETVLASLRRTLARPQEDPSFREFEKLNADNPVADYHAAMRVKYELASRRPWEPVASDPPPP